ncbi:hypothetical protein TCEL_01008 [Thermobrachium celere DSM 8682]|uniref:Uncharacterized protein n=1 Tax=Thermobrachium celere DSM 8682 TaxID=941824 RepID=R7RRU7_9CLOT|nr:hypothetical protein TCEL_01008 [Thermobrachium celere DSM 8682]
MHIIKVPLFFTKILKLIEYYENTIIRIGEAENVINLTMGG